MIYKFILVILVAATLSACNKYTMYPSDTERASSSVCQRLTNDGYAKFWNIDSSVVYVNGTLWQKPMVTNAYMFAQSSKENRRCAKNSSFLCQGYGTYNGSESNLFVTEFNIEACSGAIQEIAISDKPSISDYYSSAYFISKWRPRRLIKWEVLALSEEVFVIKGTKQDTTVYNYFRKMPL
jgi:hypothetical protein